MPDEDLVIALQALQHLAEATRRACSWVLCEEIASAAPVARPILKSLHRTDESWRDYASPLFLQLEAEAAAKGLSWDRGPQLGEQIDLSMRGPLEREVVGAIRDAVNAHGPITRQTVNSAAKRVIGAIKTFNRRVDGQLRQSGQVACEGLQRD